MFTQRVPPGCVSNNYLGWSSFHPHHCRWGVLGDGALIATEFVVRVQGRVTLAVHYHLSHLALSGAASENPPLLGNWDSTLLRGGVGGTNHALLGLKRTLFKSDLSFLVVNILAS